VSYSPSRTDSTTYPILWGSGTSTTQAYSCASVKIQSSTGTIYCTNITDNDDTNYYLDPNGSSSLFNVTATEFYARNWFRNNDSGEGIYNQTTTQHFYTDDVSYWNVASSSGAQGIRFRTGGHGGTVRGYVYANDSNDVGLLNNAGNWRIRVVGGDYVSFDGSSARAQIFYDSNNTSYYIDAASTSNLVGLTVANTITGSVSGNSGNVTISNLNTQQVSTGTLTSGAWYTIAVNAGDRASAKFTVTNGDSGLHQAVQFYATAEFGTDVGAKISVVSNTYYSGPPIGNIRIMRGSTYDGAMVQVYLNNNCSITISIYDNQQSGGWVIKNGILSTINPGGVNNFASLTTNAAQVDLNSGKSFSVSDQLYIGGATTQYIALHANNYNSYAPTLTGSGASGSWGISITGSSASCTGNSATATILATARTIGGVSFNGSANINLPGVNTAGNQNTTGTASNVTGTVAIANGGTGATTAANAATNLGLGTGNTPKFLNVFGERVALNSASPQTINTQYNVTELTLTSSIATLTFSNIQASGIVHMWTLVTVGNATVYTITWPAAVKWPGGTAPTVTTTSGKRDIYQFVTYDGGTNIYAIIVGQNL
jgi:hypothetical protein